MINDELIIKINVSFSNYTVGIFIHPPSLVQKSTNLQLLLLR
jgi:hypothetical protein